MYPYPFYSGGMPYPPMWNPVPPAFYPMPLPFAPPDNGAPAYGFFPPPPPDFTGFYMGQ